MNETTEAAGEEMDQSAFTMHCTDEIHTVSCEGCKTPEDCGHYECISNLRREVEESERRYIKEGRCSQCGACSEEEAGEKCTASQDQTGEYSCAGDQLWNEEEE